MDTQGHKQQGATHLCVLVSGWQFAIEKLFLIVFYCQSDQTVLFDKSNFTFFISLWFSDSDLQPQIRDFMMFKLFHWLYCRCALAVDHLN